MKSDESVRALFLHLSCSFRAVCAFQYLSWNWFEKHGRARGCVSVCRNRTGVHAMRARRLKGPRGQVKTQSNRNGKRALCFVFVLSTHGFTGGLCFFVVVDVDHSLDGWMDLVLRAGPTGTKDEFVVVF